MRKFLAKIPKYVVASMLMIFALKFHAFAANLPLNGQEFSAGGIPAPSGEKSGQQIAIDLVMGTLSYAKVIVAVIGIIFISIMGYKMVVMGDNEEEVGKARTAIVYIIIAFGIISMSQDIGRIFDMRSTTLLGSPQEILKRFNLFDRQVEIAITFIKYLIGSFAVIMVIRSAAKLITAGGNEEETTKHKKGLLYSAGGLALIYVGEIFIEKVFYKVNKNVYSGIDGVHPQIDAKEGVEQLVGITNFIVSFVGPVAVLMLIVGAIMYATAAGEDEKLEQAKRLLLTTFIGIVIMYGAFALVSSVVSGRLTDFDALLVE